VALSGGNASGPEIGVGMTTGPSPSICSVPVGFSVLWVFADVADMDTDAGAGGTLVVAEIIGKAVLDFSSIILRTSDTGGSSFPGSKPLASSRFMGGVVDRERIDLIVKI